MAGIAMPEHRLASVVDQLADHEVQLQVGCGDLGRAAQEGAGLGEVGGQQAAALAPPFEDALQGPPGARRRQAEQVVQAAACRRSARRPGGRAGGGRRRAGRCATGRPRSCSAAPSPMPESISSCGDCSAAGAEQHLAPRAQDMRAAVVAPKFDADGARAFDQDARGACAGEDAAGWDGRGSASDRPWRALKRSPSRCVTW